MIVKIVPGEDGKSYFEHLDPKDWHTDWQVDPVKGPVNFGSRAPGRFHDLHTESRRQYAIVISGHVEIGIGDGTKLTFGPGDIIFPTDVTGEGHSTRTAGDEPFVFCAIPSD